MTSRCSKMASRRRFPCSNTSTSPWNRSRPDAHARRSAQAPGGSEDHHYVLHPRPHSVSRQAPARVPLRFFVHGNSGATARPGRFVRLPEEAHHQRRYGGGAFFTGTGAPLVLSDFTDDRDVLTTVLKGLPIGEDADLAGLADTGDDNGEDTGAAFVADETEFNIFNTDQKLAAIEQAAKMLASFPGKESAGLLFGGCEQDRSG